MIKLTKKYVIIPEKVHERLKYLSEVFDVTMSWIASVLISAPDLNDISRLFREYADNKLYALTSRKEYNDVGEKKDDR